jgi:hypothetical protein
MNFSGSFLYLGLFALSTVAMYLSVRRNLTPYLWTTFIGSVLNSFAFTMYSLTAGNGIVHALTVGLGLGIVFAIATTTSANFFKANPPMAKRAIQVENESLKRAA